MSMQKSDKRNELIRDALDVWAPTWPRRVTTRQQWADGRSRALRLLLEAEDEPDMEPFISTYSFPRGHTKGGNVPHIDTLFIDFDMEGGEYVSGSGDEEAWMRDLSFLLVRVNRVANMLAHERSSVGWRASLSGHKGVHLFLDFPAIPVSAGDYGSFLTGVNSFARELTADLMHETAISDLGEYIDVTSSDLGRLHRVPNTVHGGATESFGESRYCVPVTLEELAEITAEDYRELTRSPREVPYKGRSENSTVGETIKQHVVHAEPRAYRGSNTGGPSFADYEKYKRYVTEIQNDDIELEDVPLLTTDRPCVWSFHEREDKYDYGDQSHYMEVYCIRELQEKNVPVSVMKEFLSTSPKYDERYTEEIIKNVISYDYERFNVRRHIERSPALCDLEHCGLCQEAKEEIESNT